MPVVKTVGRHAVASIAIINNKIGQQVKAYLKIQFTKEVDASVKNRTASKNIVHAGMIKRSVLQAFANA